MAATLEREVLMLRPLPASRSPYTLLLPLAVHAAAVAIVLLIPRRPPVVKPEGPTVVFPPPPRSPRPNTGGGGGGARHVKGPKEGFHAKATPPPPVSPAPPMVEPPLIAVSQPSGPEPGRTDESGGDPLGLEGMDGPPGEGRGPTGPGGEPGNVPGGTGTGDQELQPDEPTILGSDMTPPVLVHRVEPEYPPMAKRAGARGTVVLKCVIGADGRVEVRSVHHSVALLDDAAIDAVSQWRYEPARWNGRPQAVYQTVRVEFSIR